MKTENLLLMDLVEETKKRNKEIEIRLNGGERIGMSCMAISAEELVDEITGVKK